MIKQILFNKYQTFSSYNQTDLAGILSYPNQVWAGFTPLVLFALFIITATGTYFSQKRLTGRGDFFASFAVASFFTAITAYAMTLVDGLINNYTLTVTIVVAIISVILLFTTKDR